MIIEAKGDVIKIRGALVENQWTAIKSSVSLLLSDHPRGIIIDASGLTEVTEAGARTFFDASNFLQAQNSRIVVAGMPEDILAEIRNIPGIRSQLVIAPTVEDARASLDACGVGVVCEGKEKPVVLVPLIGAWHKALQFAATEAAARHAEIHLLFIFQVPRNLPLGVPMPELEQEAERDLAEAEHILKRTKLTARRLTTRARSTIDGIAKFATESKPELLTVAFTKEEMMRESFRQTSTNMLCEAPCDVAIYCVTE